MAEEGTESAGAEESTQTNTGGETTDVNAGAAPGEASTETDSASKTLFAEANGSEKQEETSEGENTESSEGAPEAYEAFTTAEGEAIEGEAIAAYSEVFKELGLSQEGAQKLVALNEKLTQESQAAAAEKFEKQRNDWRAEIQKDPNWEERMGAAKSVLTKFDKTGELTQLMEDHWMGDYPLLLNLLADVGKALGEDPIVPGNAGAPAQKKSHAETLFGG